MPHGPVQAETLHVINLARDPDDVLDLLSRAGRRHALWQGGESFEMLVDAPLIIILDGVDSDPRGPGQGMPLALKHLSDHEAESVVIVPDVSLEAEHALLQAGALEVIPRENLTPQILDRALRRARLRLSLRQEGEQAGTVAASLLDRVPLAVIFVRRDARIVHANAKAETLLARKGALFRAADGVIAMPVDGDPTEPPSELTATPLLPQGAEQPAAAGAQAVDGAAQPAAEPVLGDSSGAAPSGTIDVEQAIRNGDIRWNDPALQTEAVGSDQVGAANPAVDATGADASAPAPIKESDIIWNDPPQASEVPADIPDDSAAAARTDESVAEAGSPGDAISPDDIIWNDPAPSAADGADQTANAPAAGAETKAR